MNSPRLAVVFLLGTAAVFGAHMPFLQLPYYWDEAGQFIPAARDIWLSGKWIPVSTIPNVHPPGLMAYLALAWRLAGYTPVTTRAAMLLLAALGLFSAFLLARELRGGAGRPAYLAALLLFASPLFFAQSLLAQLDLPAMLFTTLALLLFLRGRVCLSTAVCVVLVLVKETGLMVPLVFAAWLLRDGRRRQAAWFALPAIALACWIAILAKYTGDWAGNSNFVSYNLVYPLNPVRLGVSLIRRLYFLLVADGRWIGVAAVLYAWKKGLLFRTRGWRIAATLAAAHVILVVLLGGAVLERYLLPVLPVVYAAMAAAISALPGVARAPAASLLVAGLVAGNWVNPPHPFPYEDNLAFADFLNLQQQAARYVAQRYPGNRIGTAWPLSLELSRPQLGFVSRPLAVTTIPDFTPYSLERTDWRGIQVLVTFSQTWDPQWNLMHIGPIRRLWTSCCGELAAGREQAAEIIPFRRVAHFERRGQWVDVFFTSTPANCADLYPGTSPNAARFRHAACIDGTAPPARQISSFAVLSPKRSW